MTAPNLALAVCPTAAASGGASHLKIVAAWHERSSGRTINVVERRMQIRRSSGAAVRTTGQSGRIPAGRLEGARIVAPASADAMTTKDIIALIIAAIGAAVALLTFLRALVEYTQQGRQRRTEQFFAFGRRIQEQKSFQEIRDLLDAEAAEKLDAEAAQKQDAKAAQKLKAAAAQEPDASQALAAIPASEKFKFLGAYEELALLVRSGLASIHRFESDPRVGGV